MLIFPSETNQPTYMKTSFSATFLAFAGALSLQHAGAASYTVYSDVADVGGTWVNFDVSKFNSNLGILTGVQVSVVQSDLSGSVSVTNNSGIPTTVSNFYSYFDVTGITVGLGYADDGASKSVSTTPGKATTTINPSATVVFTINSGQSFSIASQNIAAGNFSTYSSVGGSGVVRFAAQNAQSIASTGSNYSVDSTAAKTTTKFAITYTYAAAPVPEPSVVVLSAMGLSGMALVRRREKPVSRL